MLIDKILEDTKAEALLPAYQRVPAPALAPDLGMSHAPTPSAPFIGEAQGLESRLTSQEEISGDTVSVLPVS